MKWKGKAGRMGWQIWHRTHGQGP
ncbi:hypothetical protein GMOD_00004828 [Pyrenophora seminiperda CCB06]|uniref:Uncharacterized protein n=1 Tax=Pyrenophora seminiperda CCB06 TaxID=1302712 RepID=A0A3M7MHU8_9PLEO|nr:hypothetical protein GMOD_00004828 [Pyrenophora seminiperda CCB06]